MSTSEPQINDILANNAIALAGASRDSQKFGTVLLKQLVAKGYKVVPVNPFTDNIEGLTCYPSVHRLPKNVGSIMIITPEGVTNAVLKLALERKTDFIWVQEQPDTKPTILLAMSEYNKEVITGEYVLLMKKSVENLPKFHQGIKQMFGVA